jgi:hypothetical protein
MRAYSGCALLIALPYAGRSQPRAA